MKRLLATIVTVTTLAFSTGSVVAQTGPAGSAPSVQQPRNISMDLGLHWFKTAADKPNELASNAVFDRWEAINSSPDFQVHDYVPLKPLYFNMAFGFDALFRYRRYLMVKVGYDMTHPFGIGGTGHIAYLDTARGVEVSEKKSFSYTSHQLTTFIGPMVDLVDNHVDLYLGFSPMAPTWVFYREHYERSENGRVVQDKSKSYHGFFGNCRALLGLQVRVAGRFKLGSEAVFAFLNFMPLKSGAQTDTSFRFPFMQWHFTARYEVF